MIRRMFSTQDAFLPPFSGVMLMTETQEQRGMCEITFARVRVICFRRDAMIYYLVLLHLWPENSIE